jgi:CheY-like chemotaxis protein
VADRILIIDSNEDIRGMLKKELTNDGYEVYEAGTGNIAFKIANNFFPTLILSEVFLPDMEGVELCKRIKSISNIPDVPYMFLTSASDIYMENRAFQAGAIDYLIKLNVTRQEILLRIELHLQRNSFASKIERYTHMLLSGRYGQIPLVEIYRWLANLKINGALELFYSGQRSTVYFHHGKIVNAESGSSRGKRILFDIQRAGEGIYRFDKDRSTAYTTIYESIDELITELAQATH